MAAPVHSLPAIKNALLKAISFVKNFLDAGFFFPAANVCNFMQGADPIATKIAIANLVYSTFLIGISSSFKTLPEKSQMKSLAFPSPLRITAYCALAISCFLLIDAAEGAGIALFPGLAALFFGFGNLLQSSQVVSAFRSKHKAKSISKALTHPAVWYGLGYTMTGIGIGGGFLLFTEPHGHLLASFLTFIGIAETLGALGFMISGKVTNQAIPFIGVALGTVFFAMTGIILGNSLGAATGLLACAGELSLAAATDKRHKAGH